jgi:hypothetical protein
MPLATTATIDCSHLDRLRSIIVPGFGFKRTTAKQTKQRKLTVDNSTNQPSADKPQRSFVVSDFSMRDMPIAIVAFLVISVCSVILGLFVESLPAFWRGVLFGIAVTLLSIVTLSRRLFEPTAKK